MRNEYRYPLNNGESKKVLTAPVARASSAARPAAQPGGLGFSAIQPDTSDVVTVAASHSSQVPLR
jgi:hypothetical protein